MTACIPFSEIKWEITFQVIDVPSISSLADKNSPNCTNAFKDLDKSSLL